MEKGMKATFSWRLKAAIAATTAVAGGCLAGCGSSSPTVTVTAPPGATSVSSSAVAAKPGTAGFPLGQGTFQIQGSITEFSDSKQSMTFQGTVDGLALTATGTGNGLVGIGEVGQNGYCGLFGVTGTSASGTMGSVPFTVTLSNCSTDSNHMVTATYTGDWSGRAINVALSGNVDDLSGESGTTQLSGTVGNQPVSGSVPSIVLASGAPGKTSQISGTLTVSS
jgi:hypothetical protein